MYARVQKGVVRIGVIPFSNYSAQNLTKASKRGQNSVSGKGDLLTEKNKNSYL